MPISCSVAATRHVISPDQDRQELSEHGGSAVAEDREVALDAASGVSATGSGTLRETRNVRLLSAAWSRSRWCRRWSGAGTVLPDQIAGCRIERLNDTARIRQIHDAVVDERRRLLRTGVVHRP